MNKEQENQLKEAVINSQVFTEMVSKLSEKINLEPFSFCLSIKVMGDACEHAFKDEWAAAEQLFNSTMKGKNSANQ